MPALVNDPLRLLRGHSLVKSVRVLEYDQTPAGRLELKIRCRLEGDCQLQIWLHHGADVQDYAYQLFSDRASLRWDNSPHYPDVATAPHHFHNEAGQVGESPLSGKAMKDLRDVLSMVEDWLAKPPERPTR